jgi:archaellum biogenesis protein FlaJ (TadC family)
MSTDKNQLTSRLAIAAGLTGVVAFFFGPAGILAIILSILGFISIKRAKGGLSGNGLCIFGAVMGVVSILVPILIRESMPPHYR